MPVRYSLFHVSDDVARNFLEPSQEWSDHDGSKLACQQPFEVPEELNHLGLVRCDYTSMIGHVV